MVRLACECGLETIHMYVYHLFAWAYTNMMCRFYKGHSAESDSIKLEFQVDEVEACSSVGKVELSVLDEILSVESGSKPGLDGASNDGRQQKKEVYYELAN